MIASHDDFYPNKRIIIIISKYGAKEERSKVLKVSFAVHLETAKIST